MTSKVDLRTVGVKIFLMAVDPYHRYPNESGRANEDIYDGFKKKKTFGLHGLYKNNLALQVLIIKCTVFTEFSKPGLSTFTSIGIRIVDTCPSVKTLNLRTTRCKQK